MAIRIADQAGSFRLITDGGGRFAVVEARAGHVYSMHGHHRREAEDGMRRVVGDDGWFDEAAARKCFETAARDGENTSRIVW